MGFRELASQLIAMGAKYGNMPVDEVLPSARTVSRHLATVAEAQKRNLKSKLSDIKRLAVTADMWTHESTTTPYITITVHYVNDRLAAVHFPFAIVFVCIHL